MKTIPCFPLVILCRAWQCYYSARLNGGTLSVLAVQMVGELYLHVFGVINVAPVLYSKILATIGLTGNPDGYTLYCDFI